jgi:hypothetical protein
MRPERADVEIPYRKVSGALCVEVREGVSRNGRKGRNMTIVMTQNMRSMDAPIGMPILDHNRPDIVRKSARVLENFKTLTMIHQERQDSSMSCHQDLAT